MQPTLIFNGDFTMSEEMILTDDPIWELEYSLTNVDEDFSYRLFQKKYVYKKCLRTSLLFLIPLALSLYQVINKPDYMMGWALVAICIAIIIMQWVNQKIIRKNLLQALLAIEGDKYKFSLFEDGFEVSTIGFIEDLENDESADEEDEKTPLPPPATYKFFDYEIEAVESTDYFILFLIEQKTYYVLPKRFMNEEKINFLSEFLQRKLEANYKKEN